MLTYLLMKTSRNLKNKLDKSLKSLDITSSQFSLINQIEMQGNLIQAHELAEILGYDRPTVSAMVRRLEKTGILIRSEHPKDKRSQLLSLTDEGHKRLFVIREIADQISQDIFKDVSPEDLEIMKTLLNHINQQLEV